MSYILDALKQSDQQRTAEPVQPLPIPVHTATGKSASNWRLVLIAVVLAGTTVSWFRTRETPENTPEVSQTFRQRTSASPCNDRTGSGTTRSENHTE